MRALTRALSFGFERSEKPLRATKLAKLTGSIMEGVIDMTWKQIEASREARLWLGQIILPAIGITMMVPEAREAVIAKTQKVKKSIKTAFTKE